MTPTIGRIVHYYPGTGETTDRDEDGPFAAVITDAGEEDRVVLYVFPYHGGAGEEGCAGKQFDVPPANEQRAGRRWQWPEPPVVENERDVLAKAGRQ